MIAIFHKSWYNVRSYWIWRHFMLNFAAQFYFSYYYFFIHKK